MSEIVELYPQLRVLESIEGIYLSEPIPHNQNFVYTNFLSSLDGRIAIRKAQQSYLPEQLTNAHDFRLFLELQAHADCIVTHGAYLRARAHQTLGDILHIGKHHKDLLTWRQQQQRASQYQVIICSNSLEFPQPADLEKRQVIIATSNNSSPAKRQHWKQMGYSVVVCGKDWVESDLLCQHLSQLNLKRVFLCTGPKMLTDMLARKQLDRLYLTISHQLIGHQQFHTLMEGKLSQHLSHCRCKQARLIYDQSKSLTHSQWYVRFDLSYRQ